MKCARSGSSRVNSLSRAAALREPTHDKAPRRSSPQLRISGGFRNAHSGGSREWGSRRARASYRLRFARRLLPRVVVRIGRRIAALARLRLAGLWFARDTLTARDQQIAFQARLRRTLGIDEAQLLGPRLVPGDDDAHDAAILQTAEQHLVRERRLDLGLDDPRHRPRAHRLVITVGDEPGARLVRELDRDVAIRQLRLELQDELVTTLAMTSCGNRENGTIASSRLRNSGENSRLIASVSSPSRFERWKPNAALAMSCAPALVVMIRITLRKSICLPEWSVNLPWSITCKRILKRSGWAFSISSSSSTQWGCWSIASVSRPPWSKPT